METARGNKKSLRLINRNYQPQTEGHTNNVDMKPVFALYTQGRMSFFFFSRRDRTVCLLGCVMSISPHLHSFQNKHSFMHVDP